MSWWDDNHEKCPAFDVEECSAHACTSTVKACCSQTCPLQFYHDTVMKPPELITKPSPAKVKRWQWIYKEDGKFMLTTLKYTKKQGEGWPFIEPYLPSEEEVDA